MFMVALCWMLSQMCNTKRVHVHLLQCLGKGNYNVMFYCASFNFLCLLLIFLFYISLVRNAIGALS